MVPEAPLESTEQGHVAKGDGWWARDRSVDNPDWGGYPVDETAISRGAGVGQETNEPEVAYAHLPKRQPAPYQDGWLPG